MKKRWLQIGFLGATALVLVLGGLCAVLFPREMNTYENRYAEQFPALTAASYADGSFQSGLETALADQLPKASALKKLYHLGTRGYVYALLSPLSETQDSYFAYFGVNLTRGDRLVYGPRELDPILPRLEARTAQLNAAAARNPDTDFYLYYIEKDTDLDFETGHRLGASDAIAEWTELPMAVFAVDAPEVFYRDFYATDHHWNYLGSFRAYEALTTLLDCGEPVTPVQSVTLDQTITGSKAASIGAHQLTEKFCAYLYDFPSMTVTLDGQPAADYGQHAANFQGLLSYGNFYGGDNGEVILDSGCGDDRLLILGESYDNAVLKLLACHFDRVHAVDLRYYETLLGQPFDLDSYLRAHQIDRVLFMGNLDYFLSDDFALEQ